MASKNPHLPITEEWITTFYSKQSDRTIATISGSNPISIKTGELIRRLKSIHADEREDGVPEIENFHLIRLKAQLLLANCASHGQL